MLRTQASEQASTKKTVVKYPATYDALPMLKAYEKQQKKRQAIKEHVFGILMTFALLIVISLY